MGLKPRFLAGAPPTDADIAAVIQKLSRRVIRSLRHLGYLEMGMEPPVLCQKGLPLCHERFAVGPSRDHERLLGALHRS